jgi:hypothetical protein
MRFKGAPRPRERGSLRGLGSRARTRHRERCASLAELSTNALSSHSARHPAYLGYLHSRAIIELSACGSLTFFPKSSRWLLVRSTVAVKILRLLTF